MENEKLIIEGQDSAKTLEGVLQVSGAKNSVLKEIASSILFENELKIKNVPKISDVNTLLKIMEKIGWDAKFSGANSLSLKPARDCSTELPIDLARSFRASIVLSGPILSRMKKVSFPFPGGDKIGLRPIDLFLNGFKKMGAEVFEDKDSITAIAPRSGLKGARIFFGRQSVTATETLMLAAVLANGETILENCAMEPEILHLAEFLNKCGAEIAGAGTHEIRVSGRNGKLLQAKTDCVTPPDRIEAGTFLILGALTARNLKIEKCDPKEMTAVIDSLSSAGVPIIASENSIEITDNTLLSNFFSSSNVTTHEYPGFPTDLQAPMAVFLSQITGQSILFETIWEDRFRYIDTIKLMGADVLQMDPHRVLIKGPAQLRGQEMESPDIRAGLAYVIAALCAKGESKIGGLSHIDRGYENIEERLRGIGAKIVRK